MIIIRTHPNYIDEVFRTSKHALKCKPKMISQGDLILISQTIAQSKDSIPPIRYVMEFVEMHFDYADESKKLFGKHWPYMVYGRNCRELTVPFDIREIQGVSGKNYSQGGTFVYVAKEDEDIILQCGYLK